MSRQVTKFDMTHDKYAVCAEYVEGYNDGYDGIDRQYDSKSYNDGYDQGYADGLVNDESVNMEW